MAEQKAKKAAGKRRPTAKRAPQGDQPAYPDHEKSREERKIESEVGDPARRPDPAGSEVRDESRPAPEQKKVAASDELEEKREQIGVRVREQPRHDRTEITHEVRGVEDGTVTVSTAEGRVTIRTDKNVVLDQHGAADLKRVVERAFQAVS